MSLAQSIFTCFCTSESFCPKRNLFSPCGSPKNVHARLYDNLGVKFERIAKGVYKTIDGDATYIFIEDDGRNLSMLKDNSIDCILTNPPWLDLKSN